MPDEEIILPPSLMWERPNPDLWGERQDIVGQREIEPDVFEVLLHNDRMPYLFYTGLGFGPNCPDEIRTNILEENLHRDAKGRRKKMAQEDDKLTKAESLELANLLRSSFEYAMGSGNQPLANALVMAMRANCEVLHLRESE